jgi:hypothetical protein
VLAFIKHEVELEVPPISKNGLVRVRSSNCAVRVGDSSPVSMCSITKSSGIDDGLVFSDPTPILLMLSRLSRLSKLPNFISDSDILPSSELGILMGQFHGISGGLLAICEKSL